MKKLNLFFALLLTCVFAAPSSRADTCPETGCWAAYGFVPLGHGQLMAAGETAALTITDMTSEFNGKSCSFTSDDRIFDMVGLPAVGTVVTLTNPNVHILAAGETTSFADQWLKMPPAVAANGQCTDVFSPQLPGVQLPQRTHMQILGYRLEGGPVGAGSLMFAIVRVRREQ